MKKLCQNTPFQHKISCKTMQLGSIAKKVKEIPRFSGKSGVFLSFFSYRPQSGLGKHFLGAKWGILYIFSL